MIEIDSIRNYNQDPALTCQLSRKYGAMVSGSCNRGWSLGSKNKDWELPFVSSYPLLIISKLRLDQLGNLSKNNHNGGMRLHEINHRIQNSKSPTQHSMCFSLVYHSQRSVADLGNRHKRGSHVVDAGAWWNQMRYRFGRFLSCTAQNHLLSDLFVAYTSDIGLKN